MKYPDTVVEKALILYKRGLSMREVRDRIAESHQPAPSWELVRHWVKLGSRQAARVAGRIQ